MNETQSEAVCGDLEKGNRRVNNIRALNLLEQPEKVTLVGDVWVKSKSIKEQKPVGGVTKKKCYLKMVYESVCVFTFSSVVCVGWRAMGVCLPEGV